MASLTYACFVSAKGHIRGLSANSSNIAFEVPLASNDGGNKDSQLRNMPFTNLKKVQEFDNEQLWLALHTYVYETQRVTLASESPYHSHIFLLFLSSSCLQAWQAG